MPIATNYQNNECYNAEKTVAQMCWVENYSSYVKFGGEIRVFYISIVSHVT